MPEEKITGQVKVEDTLAQEIQTQIKNVDQLGTKIKEYITASATELLGVILGGTIVLRASDVHIEPEEELAKLRIRIDGMLHQVIDLDLKVYNYILSRIKLLAGLKLNIHDRPQDGRFTILFQDIVIEIRCSILPAERGEAIVLRALDPQSLIEIEDLGLRKDLATTFSQEIKRPNGMIIVTGPTGSGKTTTLYAVLKKVNRPEIKIITIEDPIEYHLAGLSQTQVEPKKGYTFASGLRSIMRQDPDIILVGEIRDLETAEIACQAALTGHLVFTTLHTNDAAGAIARMIDLGVRPISIAPAVNMVVAQRLPRKVCKHCVKFVAPSPAEKEKIRKGLIPINKELIPANYSKPDFKIAKVVGCAECNNTGYRGRIGIYEAFMVDAEMERFILKSPSIVDMRDLAIKKGMLPMYQDGLIKVLEGITTLEEIERIVG